jgi:outer membrane immunogenic protein
MKKIALFLALLAASTVVGYAQESRQDVSISGTAFIEPYVFSPDDIGVNANRAFGALGSYRFMLTPSSALEANYGITYRNNIHYTGASLGTLGVNVNTRTQEISAAYVRSFNYKRWNPFLEAGPGVLIFLPIINEGTTTHDVKQQTTIAGFFGGGVAYEISPSFDIRAEYRGILTKVPNFNAAPENLTTNKFYQIYVPTIGVAYHF